MRTSDRERLEALWGDQLEPSCWRDDHDWGEYTEREFRLAWHHFDTTGERVDFLASDPPRRVWWRRRP